MNKKFYLIPTVLLTSLATLGETLKVNSHSIDQLKNCNSLDLQERFWIPTEGLNPNRLDEIEKNWVYSHHYELMNLAFTQCLECAPGQKCHKIIKNLVTLCQNNDSWLNPEGEIALHALLQDLFIQPWNVTTIVNVIYTLHRAGLDFRKMENHHGLSVEEILDLRLQDAMTLLEWNLWKDVKNLTKNLQ